MKIWFLRFAHDKVDLVQLKKARLVPVLFRQIPFGECSIGMEEQAIRELVATHYPIDDHSAGKRGQYVGTLFRFLTQVQVGDVIAVCLNRAAVLLYGEIVEGGIVEFPGIPDSKARSVRWLTATEMNAITAKELPQDVRLYSGTICLWQDEDVLDQDEKKKLTFYSSSSKGPKQQAQPHQIKFIRVGVDMGCGGRLSRLFPGDYYHFIPIPQHNDPEFCRYTYGDRQGATKFSSLLTLRQGDILVFYAGFETEPKATPYKRVVAIFAYFVVRELYMFNRNRNRQEGIKVGALARNVNLLKQFSALANKQDFQSMLDYCESYNEHAVVGSSKNLEIIVCGERKQSRLIRKAEHLADANSAGKYILDVHTAARWGLLSGADLTRCSVRTVDPSQVAAVAARLSSLP